jgi:hypothetical protein
MADTGRTVFADGLWADDLWAAGFWSTTDAAPAPEPTTPTPAGKGKKRHKHRYFVQIDGQDFEVRDQQEAIEVLQKAAALAEVAAERQAKAAKPQQAPKVEPVKLAPPVIRTNAPIDLEPYREAIERAYRNAAMAEEMRRLLEAQMWDDEEAAVYLLLH